nr:immunity protein Tsi6 family protein [Pantoea vagans]
MINKGEYTALDYINDAIDITNQRALDKPDFTVFQVALKQLVYVKKY